MKPKRFEKRNLPLGSSSVSVMLTVPVTQAREAGQAMQEELESLVARVEVASVPSIAAAQKLSKEIGVLMNVCNSITSRLHWKVSS